MNISEFYITIIRDSRSNERYTEDKSAIVKVLWKLFSSAKDS